jgi:hypothetical protein
MGLHYEMPILREFFIIRSTTKEGAPEDGVQQKKGAAYEGKEAPKWTKQSIYQIP